MKIGIRLESLRLPLRRALVEAGRMGVAGVQVDALADLSPNQLSQTGRREFRNLLRAHNLELTALGCPLRHGLDAVEDQDARIEHVRKVLALSFDLGPRLVIIQAGRAREDAVRLHESLLALGQYGDRIGTVLALETGLESGESLAAFLGRMDTGGLGVNFDPANLLINELDPYASALALRGRIVHAHAKDARSVTASKITSEVPLGHGDLDWVRLLGVLEEIEYRAWLVVERESGDNPLADVAGGVKFLRRLVP